MKKLNEKDIFKILNESNQDSISETIQIDDTEKKLFKNYYRNLTVGIDNSTIESQLTSNNTYPWVNTLLFHKNLNLAIDYLNDYEVLKEKELSLLSYLMTDNYIKSSLKEDIQAHDYHNSLVENDNIEDTVKTLNYRKIKKIFDLIEYTKASKRGGKLLYGIDNIYNHELKGIHRIREDLRNLLYTVKKIEKNRQETVLSVGARGTKDSNGEYIVKNLESLTSRVVLEKLTSVSLIFDMKRHSFFERIDNNQIINIGIEVIDDYACKLQEITNPPHENQLKLYSQRYWGITLEDNSNGLKISNVIDDRHNVNKTFYNNITGGKNQKIIWANNETLINVNANRKWEVKINSSTIPDSSAVFDIILHFHISFINS